MKLTDEQLHAVELARTGETLKIEAFAGTGKTSTLKAIAEALPDKRIVYLAFNKAIADEAAGKFPPNVSCRTSHSMAFREFGAPFGKRLGQKLNGDALAMYLGVFEFHGMRPRVLCSMALETLRIFCQGADKKIASKHLPRAEMAALGVVTDAEAVGERILQIAEQAWKNMKDPDGTLPVTHDFYLKLWAMSKPRIPGDIIMLDEGQDTNRLLLKTLEDQLAQMIYVGDRYQQLYSWRGAINAMDLFETAHVARLTQSFRFGPAVAETANDILSRVLGCKFPIKGNPAKESRIAPVEKPEAILCRTNAECIRQVMRALSNKMKVKLQGGTSDLKYTIKGIKDLKDGRIPSYNSLALFSSFDQLKDFAKTELGRDLQSILNLIKEYGEEGLLATIENIEGTRVDQADVIVSTGHKSKGCEWETVRLGSDFRAPGDKGYQDEDGNLLYVAATRAIQTLDLTQLAEMFDNRGKLRPEAFMTDEEKQAKSDLETSPHGRDQPLNSGVPLLNSLAENAVQ